MSVDLESIKAKKGIVETLHEILDETDSDINKVSAERHEIEAEFAQISAHYETQIAERMDIEFALDTKATQIWQAIGFLELNDDDAEVETPPVVVEEPAPVVIEEPAPVVVEEPVVLPPSDTEPTTVEDVVVEPAPLPAEEPVVVEDEPVFLPAPVEEVVAVEPAPVVVEEPLVTIDEPAPVAVEEVLVDSSDEVKE